MATVSAVLWMGCGSEDEHPPPVPPPVGMVSHAELVPAPREPSSEPTKPGVKRDYGCAAAARRFLKKMRTCDLNADGITEEMLCNRIDSMTIRMVADSDSCDEFLRYMNIKD